MREIPQIRFIVEGKPQGKARPVVTRTGHTFTPKKTVEYEKQIIRKYNELYPNFKMEGNLFLHIDAYFSVPESYSKKKKVELLGKPYDKKPDFDNICKIVCDALNGIAYDDDKSIVDGSCKKYYSDKDFIEIFIGGSYEG